MIPEQCHLWKSDTVNPDDLTFKEQEVLIKSTYGERTVIRCTQCGQLYFCEALAFADLITGETIYYTVYVPASPDEIQKLTETSSRDLLKYTPRLQWDNDKPPKWYRRPD